MDDGGSPALEVGFAITTGGSLEELQRLSAAMDSAEAKILRDAKNIETVTGGMLNLAGQTASVAAFASTTTTSFNKAEQAAERLTRRLQEQTATIGMTRAQVVAWRAEQAGATDAANELRQAETALNAARSQSISVMQAEAGAALGLGGAHGKLAAGTGLSRIQLLELGHVATALTDSLAAGINPARALFLEMGRLGQVASLTEGGALGLARILATMFLPVIVPATTAALAVGGLFAAFKQFQGQVKDSGELTRYRDSLGLTHKEMLQLSDGVDKVGDKIKTLGDVTITAGDVMAGLWKTIQDGAGVSGEWDSIKKSASSAFGFILDTWNVVAAGITAGINGTFNVVKTVWGNFPAVFGDLFVQGVNAAIAALNRLVKAGVDQINGLIDAANRVTGLKLGSISAPQIDLLDNAHAGAAAKVAKQIGASYSDAYAEARKADAKFWEQVGTNAKQHAKDRMSAEARALREDRTPKAPKVDHSALDAQAEEAKIANAYKLADAYGVSGAAALLAEAREKAESEAIKKRGDVAAEVDRQQRLAIAQRAVDAAKSTAASKAQTEAQEQVNAMVAAGLAPASKAAELVKAQIDDQKLLDAIAAAAQIHDLKGIDENTKALAAQRAERERGLVVARQTAFQQASEANGNQLAQLQEELRLVGATDAVRVHSLAVLKATQEAEKFNPGDRQSYIDQQTTIADTQLQLKLQTDAANKALSYQADLFEALAANVDRAGQAMEQAFGRAGGAIGSMASSLADYLADHKRLQTAQGAELRLAAQIKDEKTRDGAVTRINSLYAIKSAGQQIGLYGDLISGVKSFAKEGSAAYEALSVAEKVYRAAQLALSVAAVIQNGLETGVRVANSAAQATAEGTTGIAAQSKLPFPLNLVAMAATAAALIAAGIAVFGGGGGSTHTAPVTNTGTGTVLGDPTKQSESIKNAIDALKQVDLLTNNYSRQMAASLKSIDSQIGGVAALVSRSGNVNANDQVATGFKTNAIGSVLGAIPLIGGFLSSLFGTRTDILGGGISASPQTVGSIVSGGFNAQNYTDIQKVSKFLGIVTGRRNETIYGAADPTLTKQFTLIIKSFDDAIAAAAGPLGQSTDAIKARLSNFVVDIGRIDLNGLSGDQIQEKLSAVFGAAADQMASGAFPEIVKYQKVGEGAFETLVRVASTVEQVTTSLDELGTSARALGIDAKLGLAGQFDSISDLTSAVDAYFQAFYTPAEQAAAKTAQLTNVLDSLGLTLPATIAGYRQLVDAQDLNTTAGQETYATLLKLAPAFADLQSSMEGAKSAADILSERQDLQRQLLELSGDTAALRALDLAKVDVSNRALQQQVWALQDAQDAAKAAQDLADSWKSVGDTIAQEIARIRGLSDTNGSASFATLLGQFNAANVAARGGDQDAAKSLPGLSQSLLTAAANAATSRQELTRVQAQTAAALEATQAAITAFSTVPTASVVPARTITDTMAAAVAAQGAVSPSTAANDDTVASNNALTAEVTQLRSDLTAALAAIAANTNRTAKTLENVTQENGGTAVTVAAA